MIQIFLPYNGGIFSDPWYGGSNNVFGEKEKCRVVFYDKRQLKPPGHGQVWISPLSIHRRKNVIYLILIDIFNTLSQNES